MSNENTSVEESQESSGPSLIIDRRILFIVYRKKIRYIIIFTIICMIIAGIWAKVNISPTWKARCFMIMAPKNMSTPVEMPYLYQTFDIHTVLETVRIRDVLVDVIKKLDLKTTPEALFKAVDVQRGNRSSVLSFTATWPDREMAAKIANATATSFITNNIRLMNSATQKIYQYYLQEKQNRLLAIQNLEFKNDQFREQYGVISVSQESQSKFDQLKEVEIEMIKNQLKATEMDSKISEMNKKLADVPAKNMLNWTYSQTDQRRLLDLQRELETLRTRYTDDNPKVSKVIDDIRELQKTTSGDSRDLPDAETWGPSGLKDVYTIDKSRFEAERQASLKMNKEFKTKIDSIRTSLGDLTTVEKEFLEIDRQLQLNRDILRIVEARLAESQMSIQSNVSDYEIIESAKPPVFPEGTNRKMVVLGIGILIFGLCSVFVIGKEILDPYLKSDKDFSGNGMMPLIGLLPDEDQFEKNVYLKNLQVLVDNIMRLSSDNRKSVLAFGSDVPETGKSFLICDIIRMLSDQKKRILYIDSIQIPTADTEPYLLNNYLYDITDKYQIQKRSSNISHAYFLSDEHVFSLLLDSKRVSAFLDSQTEYDYIFWELFDYQHSPLLFSSIVTAADALIMVGRFKRSSRSSLVKINKYLKERKFTNVYGVLNYVHKDFFPKE